MSISETTDGVLMRKSYKDIPQQLCQPGDITKFVINTMGNEFLSTLSIACEVSYPTDTGKCDGWMTKRTEMKFCLVWVLRGQGSRV